MPLQQVGPFNTGDIVAATTQNVHMDNANKLDRRTGFDPIQPGYVLCSAPTVAGLPNGVWQLIAAANLGPQSVTNAKLDALAVTDDKIAAQTILNRSLSTGLIDARTLGSTAIVDKLGYRPANVGGDIFSGAVTVLAGAGVPLIMAQCAPNLTLAMYAAVLGGYAGSNAGPNDALLMAQAGGPNTINLALGAWSSSAAGPLGIVINAIGHSLEMAGPMNGSGQWTITRAGPALAASIPAMVAGAGLVSMVGVGQAGVPAIALTTQGVGGVALYATPNASAVQELWTAGTNGAKGRVWTSGNDGALSGLDADLLWGHYPSLPPIGNAVPFADPSGKLAIGWLPAAGAPTANQIPIGDGAGKLAVGWLPASVAAAANQIPIADASGKIAAGYLPAVSGGSDVISGLICLWGAATAPTGWVLLSSVLPNIVGRFVAGAGSGWTAGTTGGSNTHRHQMDHGHGGTVNQTSSGGNQNNVVTPNPTNAAQSHQHTFTIDATSLQTGQPNGTQDLPPWLALTYIQKS